MGRTTYWTSTDEPADESASRTPITGPATGWRDRLEVGWAAAAAYVGAVAGLGWWSPAGLAVLVALTVLVLIHEGGHLVAARRCGIAATEFFAGFGPVVVAWRTPDGLRLGLKVIPAGGYVKLVGMSRREQVAPEHEDHTFRGATRRRRLAVVVAGPAVNLVFGFALLVGAALVQGDTSVAGAVSDAWHRGGQVTSATFDGLGAVMGDLGGYGAAMAEPSAADEAPSRFLSPVGVAQLSTDLAAQGAAPLIRLMAVASIGLGVMNLLPLPPLDGGHAALAGIEGIVARLRRRPELRIDVSNRWVTAVTAVTFTLVVLLGASSVLFDIASPVRL